MKVVVMCASLAGLAASACASHSVPEEFLGFWVEQPGSCTSPFDLGTLRVGPAAYQRDELVVPILKATTANPGVLHIATGPSPYEGLSVLTLSGDSEQLRLDEGGEAWIYVRCPRDSSPPH